jgi:thiamine biosynthesis lipoprotein
MESPHFLNYPLALRQYFVNFGKVCGLLIMAGLSTGCSEQSIQKIQGFAQGTSYHISYWPESPINHDEIKAGIESEFDKLDRLLSNYRPDSVIESFNKFQDTDSHDVGKEIVSLVRIAQKVHDASQGCYDLTVKPLFELWGFNSEKPAIPNELAIDQSLKLVGMEKLEIVDETHLRKKIPGLRVDLSSIAQGYSVESIAKVLEQKGIEHYLVEIGGELKTHGHKPGMQPWRIAVERPLPGEQMLHKIITMPTESPIAIMTSGTYRHYFDDNGKRYSHILDARAGRPVTHNLVSVTVAYEDPALADAWSTALLCLGQQEGMKAANAHAIPALFIEQQDNNKLIESRSDPLNALSILTIQ